MISYYLEAIVDDLQTHLSLGDENCDVMPDTQPKPLCGQVFVGVVGAAITNPDPGMNILRQELAVTIALTTRLNISPIHRSKRRYLEDSTSILSTAMKICKRLHGNYDLLDAAKTLLDASDVGGYYTGRLTFLNMPSNPTMVDHTWFYADEDKNQNMRGLFIPISFGGIRWSND
jgi:hypothetical protein